MEKIIKISLAVFAVIMFATSCSDDNTSEGTIIGPDIEEILAIAEGGTYTFTMHAEGNWIASATEPWVLISPTNGTQTTECTIRIDSTVAYEMRQDIATFSMEGKTYRVPITQSGFGYQILISEDSKTEYELPDYAAQGETNFYVDVIANVKFKVNTNANWITYRSSDTEQDLSNKAKPRKTRVYFDWRSNYDSSDKNTTIEFIPEDNDIELIAPAYITVNQEAGPIITDDRAGDSTVIVILYRNLQANSSLDTSVSMDHWEGVELNDEGRVTKFELKFFHFWELFPEQIKSLRYLEELDLWGGLGQLNKYMTLDGTVGELPNLKKLTLRACWIEDVSNDLIGKLDNLEELDLGHNALFTIPKLINKQYLPNLKVLRLNTNKRVDLYDVSNTSRPLSELGLGAGESIPEFLLEWDELEALALNVNFFEGSIPTMEHFIAQGRVWDERYDIYSGDPLYGQPRVLPNVKELKISLNRFTGEVPAWLMYHPNICKWDPWTFIYTQEGSDSQGRPARFSNEPLHLDCDDEDLE